MKKRLFLHIGSHKTATTFLQNSFARSPRVLEELGILYPQAGRIYHAHFRLCWALKDAARASLPLESLLEWAELLGEIDVASQKIIVLSAEEFGLGLDPRRLAPLRDRYDVSIVFYMRSPDSYMESFYNQFVKDFGARETRSIETYIVEERLFFLDTFKLLAPWAETFGKEAIKLRLFSKEFLPDGILKDFLKTIGCIRFPEFTPPDSSILHKVSLPPDALEYLRLSNPWLTREEGHHHFVVQLVQMARKHQADLQQTRSGILSLKARQTLRSRFREANMRAAHAYLGLQRTPFPPREAPPPPADYEHRLPEADARLMGRIAAMIRNEGKTVE